MWETEATASGSGEHALLVARSMIQEEAQLRRRVGMQDDKIKLLQSALSERPPLPLPLAAEAGKQAAIRPQPAKQKALSRFKSMDSYLVGPGSSSTPPKSAAQMHSHKDFKRLKAFTQAIMTVHHDAGIARSHLEELRKSADTREQLSQSADIEASNPRRNRARSKSSHNVYAALSKEHETAEKSLFASVMNWHLLPNGHDDGRFRKVWDWLIVFFVMLTTYWTPFRVAFLRVKVAEIQPWEYLVDSFFAMDMILTFFTGTHVFPTVVCPQLRHWTSPFSTITRQLRAPTQHTKTDQLWCSQKAELQSDI